MVSSVHDSTCNWSEAYGIAIIGLALFHDAWKHRRRYMFLPVGADMKWIPPVVTTLALGGLIHLLVALLPLLLLLVPPWLPLSSVDGAAAAWGSHSWWRPHLYHHQLTISSPSRSKIISLYSCINMRAQYEWDIYIMAFNHVQHLIIRQEGICLVHNFPHQDSSQRCLILWHIDPALMTVRVARSFAKGYIGQDSHLQFHCLYCTVDDVTAMPKRKGQDCFTTYSGTKEKNTQKKQTV